MIKKGQVYTVENGRIEYKVLSSGAKWTKVVITCPELKIRFADKVFESETFRYYVSNGTLVLKDGETTMKQYTIRWSINGDALANGYYTYDTLEQAQMGEKEITDAGEIELNDIEIYDNYNFKIV